MTEKTDNRDSDEKLVEIEMELLRYFTKIPMADQFVHPDNGTRLNEIITKHLDDDIWELRPGNNCVLYFISKSYTSKNGKQEENHSFLLLSRYHIPSRFYQSGPFQSTDATPGLKRCMIESKSRSDPDKDSDIFINRQAAEEVIYRQVRIITLRYRKSK